MVDQLETYIGNKVDWKHKNQWEIKKVHLKHGNETGNKNLVSKHSFVIGNIIRKLETFSADKNLYLKIKHYVSNSFYSF